MVLAFLLRRLHSDVGFVGLDVIAGEQIALHHVNDGNQQFAHTQHRIVDGGQRHIDTEIAPAGSRAGDRAGSHHNIC